MKRSIRRLWTAAEKKQLRHMAKEGFPARLIAKELKRSIKAVYLFGSKAKIRFHGSSKAKKKK
jgi:hypothetical protein